MRRPFGGGTGGIIGIADFNNGGIGEVAGDDGVGVYRTFEGIGR